MERQTQIQTLIRLLLEDLPAYRQQAQGVPRDAASQRRLLRALINLGPPMPLRGEFLAMQDELLSSEREERGVTDAASLPAVSGSAQIALWRGDITRLRAEAVVNAANSALLGCFHPCHGCIDNAIHSAAGLQLREECRRIMEVQGHPEPNGRAKLTGGYNLPARYVLHTVGPVVRGSVSCRDREDLAACYRSCLALAAAHDLGSVAFCCISTGEFRFPHREAAEIAVKTVRSFLRTPSSIHKVIFNVFTDTDEQIYRELLGPDTAAATAP